MGICYNKLWKILIDRKMKKKDLMQISGVSRSTVSKLVRDEFVNIESLVKICVALEVGIEEVMEITGGQ